MNTKKVDKNEIKTRLLVFGIATYSLIAGVFAMAEDTIKAAMGCGESDSHNHKAG